MDAATTIPTGMLSEPRVRELLGLFGLALSSDQVGQVLAYLDLLLRWNRKINLTAIRDGEEVVTRHFGESLFLSRWAKLGGRCLDVGSGAGFPGLALKIVFPDLSVVLLEPVAKKRAFLKEAARTCGMKYVEVCGDRLEEFARTNRGQPFDAVTSRAVGGLGKLVPLAAGLLKTNGLICLWVTSAQSATFVVESKSFAWGVPISLPLARHRGICIGVKS